MLSGLQESIGALSCGSKRKCWKAFAMSFLQSLKPPKSGETDGLGATRPVKCGSYRVRIPGIFQAHGCPKCSRRQFEFGLSRQIPGRPRTTS